MKHLFPSLLTVAGLFFIISSFTQVKAEFADVNSEYAYKPAIDYMQTEGIVDGMNIGGIYRYFPYDYIERGAFTKIIINSLYSQDSINNCTQQVFPDVKPDHTFFKYICKAKIENIISGFSDRTFKPNQNITVGASAKIISGSFRFTNTNEFISNPEDKFEPYITALSQLNALPYTLFAIDENLTRGEMAEIIYRLKTKNSSFESRNYSYLKSNNDKLDFNPSVCERYDYFYNSETDQLLENIKNKYDVCIRYLHLDGYKSDGIEFSYPLTLFSITPQFNYFHLLVQQLNRYPDSIIKNSGLKNIVIVPDLKDNFDNVNGISAYNFSTIYFNQDSYGPNYANISIEDSRRKTINHELYHFIDKASYDGEWAKLLPDQFAYSRSGNGECAESIVISGFVSVYSTCSLMEDKAETFAHMMVFPNIINIKINNGDTVLKNKRDYIQSYITGLGMTI